MGSHRMVGLACWGFQHTGFESKKEDQMALSDKPDNLGQFSETLSDRPKPTLEHFPLTLCAVTSAVLYPPIHSPL